MQPLLSSVAGTPLQEAAAGGPGRPRHGDRVSVSRSAVANEARRNAKPTPKLTRRHGEVVQMLFSFKTSTGRKKKKKSKETHYHLHAKKLACALIVAQANLAIHSWQCIRLAQWLRKRAPMSMQSQSAQRDEIQAKWRGKRRVQRPPTALFSP